MLHMALSCFVAAFRQINSTALPRLGVLRPKSESRKCRFFDEAENLQSLFIAMRRVIDKRFVAAWVTSFVGLSEACQELVE